MGYVAGCQVGYKVSYQSLMDAHYGTHSRVLQYIGYKVSLRVIVVVDFQIELWTRVIASMLWLICTRFDYLFS